MIKNSLFLSIFLAGMTILSACQDSGQAPVNLQDSKVQGPSDGGGGDTCNGRMIESYRVNILDLPEYNEHVKPRLEKVIPAKDKEYPVTGNGMILLSPIIKNWYLIDCKLDDIPKERKGLFLDTYQTAMHTKREVFIDSKSYKAMNSEEKGKLLLHEMVMGLYLSKYLSIEDFCNLTLTCKGDYARISKWKKYRPLPYQALNAEDHQKIRNLTIWLWSDSETQTPQAFENLLKKNDFDQRFMNMAAVENSHQEIDLDPQVLVRMFKKHQWTKSFPQFCDFDLDTNISKSQCQVDIQSGIRTVQGVFSYQELYLDVYIERQRDHRVIQHTFVYPLMRGNQKIKLFAGSMDQFTLTAPLMITSNWPSIATKDPQEGMRSYTMTFILGLKDLENPEILQMMYESQVWHTFEEKTEIRDGQVYQVTYAYGSTISSETESLFIEADLPFQYISLREMKSMIKSVWKGASDASSQ